MSTRHGRSAPRAAKTAQRGSGESARVPRASGPLALVFAVGAGLLLHASAIRRPFFADDWLFLDVVRGRSLPAALTAPDPIGNFFRPVGRALWFWLLARVGGESPVAFHGASLLLFASAIALVWALVRQVAGARAAAIAAACFALTPAADVPVLWASGSQDLLAVVLSLTGMLLLAKNRRWAAAPLFLLAPLAKEVAAVALLPAALLARRRGEPWRATLLRVAPSLVALAAWAALAAGAAARHARPGVLAFSWSGALAALLGTARTFLGIEWSTGGAGITLPGLVAVVAIAVAAAAAFLGFGGTDAAAEDRPMAWPGAIAWVLAAAVPVAFVAPIWSSYFFLFAMAGAALLAGLVLRRGSAAAAVVAVLVVGLLGRRAAELPEFATAPGAFTAQSHVNRFYLERGMAQVDLWIRSMHEQVPTIAPNTTIFLAGLPAFAALQAGDGPMLRAVYHDPSLRSYYLSDLTPERLARGPVRFVFSVNGSGGVIDRTREPNVWVSVALGSLLDGHEATARAALDAGVRAPQATAVTHYLDAFMKLDAGDREGFARELALADCRPGRDGSAALADARARLAARDTAQALEVLFAAARENALDPRVHALAGDLHLADPALRGAAPMECYIARVLAPEDPAAWNRWAWVLFWNNRFAPAEQALQRFFALGGEAARNDPQARAFADALVRARPGGELAQRALRNPTH